MPLCVSQAARIEVVRGALSWFEVGVCASRQDAVEPGLLVLVARRREGGAGELLVVEAIWRFLRVIGANRQSALYGFSFMIAAESVLIFVLFRQAELGDGHLGGELYEGRVRGEREREQQLRLAVGRSRCTVRGPY